VVPIAPPPYAVPSPSAEQARAREAWATRGAEAAAEAAREAKEHAEATRGAAQANVKAARRLRRAFQAGE
jgi:hypothetical protein